MHLFQDLRALCFIANYIDFLNRNLRGKKKNSKDINHNK